MLHRAVSLRVPSIGQRRQPLRAMASQSRDPGYELVIKQWPNKPGVPGDCPFCHRVLLTLAQKNIAYKTTLVDLTQKRPEWLLQASGGKVPVLRQESSGMVMPDSDVIVQHLEKEFPQPSMTSDIDPKIGSGLFPAFRAFLSAPKDAADTDKLQAALEGQLQEVEAALQAQKGPLFGGDTLNATDAALGPKLYHAQVALQHLKGYTLPDRFSALHKYLDYIKQQPAWQATDYGAAAIVAGWSAHH
ncbi:dehydroascorbate reductase [Haematococcus lacustris]